MRRIRSTGMKPELTVRRALHALGYRFRLHRHDLAGRPDMVFGPSRKIIFVHGCFWHQHPGCNAAHLPQSNLEYWRPKLARTVDRDARNAKKLEDNGWRVLVIWECQTKDLDILHERLRRFLDEAQGSEMQTNRPKRQRRYDPNKIGPIFETVLADIGPEKFSGMRLLELERLVRGYDPNHELPAKTTLRAAINSFRTARWPGSAPKRATRRY